MPPDYQETAPRRISFVRLGIVLLVLIGLGTLVWAIFFRSAPTNQATNPPAATPSQPTQAQHQTAPNQSQHTSNNSSTSGTSSSASSGSSSTSSNTSSSTSSSTPNSTSQPNPPTPAPSGQQAQQLSNTGPGDTVALFIGVTVVGALVRYAVIRRSMQSKSYR